MEHKVFLEDSEDSRWSAAPHCTKHDLLEEGAT